MWRPFSRSIRNVSGVFALLASASLAQANNVQVALEGSLLTVFGDNVANTVRISQTATEVVVTGSAGTLINGLPSVSFPGAVLNAVEARMENGNDSLTLVDVQVANDLYVSLGEGNDFMSTSGVNSVGANATIEGGAGADTINLTGMVVFEDTFVDGGLGVLVAEIAGADLGKGLTVLSDAGADRIRVSNSTIGEMVAIDTKGGNDTVSLVNSMSFSVFVQADLGTDSVTVSDWMTIEDIGIFTGAGNDTVSLTSVVSGKSLTVSVDAGNDTVTGVSVSVTADAVFEGGAGTDTITDRGITGGIKKDIKEFERTLR